MAEQIKSRKTVLSRATIMFAVSFASVILAFSSGASAIGMVFIVVAIGSLGFGAGCLMNSPCAIAHENQQAK
ncbi:MAG: hypothetical protein PHU06_01595 [Gallionella sp.]|nr:hypothetical protein [Gallionella sp.]MDD4957858.1 hypothetical protein [Gallionella sp.]